MKISQIRDKVNIPQKVELQAALKKQWSLSQMLDMQYCLFYRNVVEQRPSTLPRRPGIWFPPTSNSTTWGRVVSGNEFLDHFTCQSKEKDHI